MTVAAVILAASPESALADAAGRPAVRRICEVAWAGGAVPIVVVCQERDGEVAAALAGAQAILAQPAPVEAGAVGQMARGMRVAVESVVETDAGLLWPARMSWVDAETVTSLIQAHGAGRDRVLRPSWQGEPGWPVLFPVARLDAFEALGTTRTPDELIADLEAAGVAVELIDLGDPGATHGRDVAFADVPPFEGPATPVAGPPPEWGAPAADRHEDEPLQGPSLAPYPQAADPEG